MNMRLAGTLVLALSVAALATAPAYAGNGQGNGNDNGNGNGNSEPAAASAATGSQSSDQGNSADAQGKASNDTQDKTRTDTHVADSSNQTKQNGNGQNDGQVGTQNGPEANTDLQQGSDDQQQESARCSGGHTDDVHACKGKHGKPCGAKPPSSPPAPRSTPGPGKVDDPASNRNTGGSSMPAVLPSSPSAAPTTSLSAPSTFTAPKPDVSPQQGRVEMAAGVLGATGAVGGGMLPFTGFPIWVVALIACLLITVGLILRRRSRTPSS
jgi:hypothetical protein